MITQNKSSVIANVSPKTNWKERFDSLDDNDKNVLYFAAIHTAPIRKITVQELCRRILSSQSQGITKFLSAKNIATEKNSAPIVTNLEKLAREGWIRLIGNMSLVCTEDYRELIIQELVQSQQYRQYASVLLQKIGGLYFFSGYDYSCGGRSFERPSMPEDIIREFRHILITKNSVGLYQIFPYILQNDPSKQNSFYNTIKNFCTSNVSRTWFENTSIEIQSLIGQFFLVQTISNPILGLGDMWEQLIQTASTPHCNLMLQIILLDYAFCSGKLDDQRLNHLTGNTAPVLLNAHRSFLIGNYKEAAKLYQLMYKIMPGIKWIKNSPIPYLSGVFHCLAELAAGDHSYVSKIIKNASLRTKPHSINGVFLLQLDGCWKVIDTITQRLNGLEPERISLKTLLSKSSSFWLQQLLYGYEGIWFQLKTTPELNLLLLEYVRKNRIIFPWIAAESLEIALAFGAAKPPDSGWVETFRTKSKSAPLKNLLTPREPWELILESLGTLTSASVITKKSETAGEHNKSRLIWKIKNEKSVHHIEFLPYQQTWNEKSQSWTKGKPVALARLFKSIKMFPFLTDQDRDICSSIQEVVQYRYHSVTYELDSEVALKFIGHPLLFSVTEPPQPMELVLGHGEIAMQEKEGKWHLTFSPPLCEYRSSYDHNKVQSIDDRTTSFFVIEETPLRFKVIKLSPFEIQIRTILGTKGQSFPKTAETQLTNLLAKLAGNLIVKTDASIEFTDVPEIPADLKLYLYLTPNGEGVQAEFFVKPLGQESQAHRPGVGAERVIAEIGGQRLQTVRNLQAESQKREQFVSKIKTFQSAVTLSKDQYIFETPLDTLNFLSELKDLETKLKDSETKTVSEKPVKKGKTKTVDHSSITEKDEKEVEIYWPYGEKFSVSSTATFGNINLAFSSLNEWLSAEGSISVDGDSFELLRLLELLDENTENRFVKLDDKKFLALTNELRKRLGELKRLSNVKGKSVQIHSLAAAGLEDFFDALPTLQQNTAWKNIKKRIVEVRDYQVPFPKGFVGDLRDYQMEGYHWLARCANWGVGCCLADDMGLGKTIQALVLLLLRADLGPALVVAPTSVCFNWEREAKRFAPILEVKRIQPITTKIGLSKEERDRLITSATKRDILLTSYSLLQQEIELFAQKKYATVILDESQAIKNPESLRAKAAIKLQTDFRVGMTGTPIENNLTELWSLFRFLNPGLLGSQKSFEDRFAIPVQRDHSAGARHTLRRLVHPFILRRTKSQVLEELPARTEIIREIELSKEEMLFYEATRTKALRELQEIKNKNSGQGKLQILAALTQLRQLCCHSKLVLPDSNIESSKLEAFREIMQELKDNRHKVLVFSQFVKHLRLLRAELDNMGISYQYLDGSTPAHERQKQVDAFQAGESDAFLISIKAGGSGLNLTAADYVIHTDPWWNPAVEDQATDRAHRIGQTRPVTVYRLITLGTIEEKIVRLHHEKRDLADKLLEGTDQTNKLSIEELIDLLQS
ncbi:MAG: DEAD/DEAH box helicase [Planctomycetaceae bacterium]|jgi:SNF2 family DNA or RNA helicase|nr:DEAD/DEAH box helicase [Planctomycetaceae bacterium]